MIEMNSNEIIKYLSTEIFDSFKKYNPLLYKNEKLVLFKKVSTKSIELLIMGMCLYFCENSKIPVKKLVFETANRNWWKSIKENLEEIYYFLTGNSINIEFKEISQITLEYVQKESEYDYLSLFSGGLDSLIGALYLDKKDERFILSHTMTSSNMFGKTKVLYNSSEILKNYPFINITTQFKSKILKPVSPQTRTLLFILNSIPICEYFGISEIKIFENIALMINPPISIYSIPTKTTRPEVIFALNKIFEKYLSFKLKIDLSFRFYTKAEMIAGFKEKEEIMKKSYSCFAYRGKKKMCGICYGCFIRIVSLAANSIFESENYISDIFKYKKYPKDNKKYDILLIIEELLDFCKKNILEEDIDEHIVDSINNANIFEDIDIWDAMLRFSKDVILGIQKYYKINDLDFKNYIIGREFLKIKDLIDIKILKEREEELKNFKIE